MQDGEVIAVQMRFDVQTVVSLLVLPQVLSCSDDIVVYCCLLAVMIKCSGVSNSWVACDVVLFTGTGTAITLYMKGCERNVDKGSFIVMNSLE